MSQDLISRVAGGARPAGHPDRRQNKRLDLGVWQSAGVLSGLWRSMRPKQWIKNGFLFAGLIFTLDHRHRPQDLLLVLAGFALFSLLSSSVYLLNDVADREQDRLHPKKRHRPIAAGQVSPVLAAGCAGVLSIGSLIGSLALNPGFGLIACLYFSITLAYSFWLKHVV